MAEMPLVCTPVGIVGPGALVMPQAMTVLLVVNARACPRPAATATTPVVGGCVATLVLVTEYRAPLFEYWPHWATLPTRCGLLHGSTQNVEEPALFLDLTTDGRYIADSLLLRAADCTMTAPERERAKMRKSTVFEFITGIVNVGDTMRR